MRWSILVACVVADDRGRAGGEALCAAVMRAAKRVDFDGTAAALARLRSARPLPSCLADVGEMALATAQAGEVALRREDAAAAAALLGASAAVAPDDGRVLAYYHTALTRSGRSADAAAVAARAVAGGVWARGDQRPAEFYPRLASAPFPPVAGRAAAAVAALEAAFAADGAALLREAERAIGAAAPASEGLQDPARGAWRYASDLGAAPALFRALAAVGAHLPVLSYGVSLLAPGAHIRPHCGPTNARWNLHLGLRVDARDEARIALRVGGETRTPWRDGVVVLFDDSYEHEVTHGGAFDRLVLDINVGHPDAAAAETRGELR